MPSGGADVDICYAMAHIMYYAGMSIPRATSTNCPFTAGAVGVKSLLHHYVWQSLPRQWRRAALFQVTSLTAPRPTPNAPASLPIIVVGTLRTASGLGQSARLSHDALKAAGEAVLGLDITAGMMQPADLEDFSFVDGGKHRGPGTILLHINSPLVPLAMLRLGRDLVRGKRIIGYWAWELPSVPSEWHHGIPFVHEIWVPSAFTANAVRSLAADRPVHVVPHPVALMKAPRASILDATKRPFTVLTIFNAASSFARKNPLASIAAFQRAFGDDPSARLIIKASNLSVLPQGTDVLTENKRMAKNILLITETLSSYEMDKLYLESDVVLSLHRSEGFGLTLAEAMARGLPVVATNWSGNVDFVNDRTGILIPYQLVPAEDPQGTYHHPTMYWAEASVDAAAEALKDLRNDPELRQRLGQAGAAHAAHAWSIEAYAQRIRQLLSVSGV
jgi:glycosyltransferase involved in cell wall biosynthesis